MLNTIGNGHVITSILIECSLLYTIHSGESIFATKLIVCRKALTCVDGLLCDGEDTFLGHHGRSLTVGLYHLYFDATWRSVAGAAPSSIFHAEWLLGKIISFVLIVPAGSGVEDIIVDKPQMPRPHHRATFCHSNHSIAILDGCCGHFELYEGIGAATCHGKVGYKSTFIAPNKFGSVGCIHASIALRNPRVGDVLVVVVFEMTQYKAFVRCAGRCLADIGIGIGCAACDGVAIDQGDFIVARVGDDITVGRVAQCGVAFHIVC